MTLSPERQAEIRGRWPAGTPSHGVFSVATSDILELLDHITAQADEIVMLRDRNGELHMHFCQACETRDQLILEHDRYKAVVEAARVTVDWYFNKDMSLGMIMDLMHGMKEALAALEDGDV